MNKKSKKHFEEHDPTKCIFCKNNLDFELPGDLLADLKDGNIVLFAGAGISTESNYVYPESFYETIKAELNTSEGEDIAFPELMERYSVQPNGRAKLLRQIKQRFDYIQSFKDLYDKATRFHKELSTLYLIENIITTNWDDYFEKECGSIPFVTPEDFTFWSLEGRKVFKIHGSINNLGSIVATTNDYKKCYENLQNGIQGSNLKLLLATKTILYVGYSFRDHDFQKIHSIIKAEMGNLLPHSYIVTLDKDSSDRFQDLGLTPIFTDATHFVNILKKHLAEDQHFLPDERFEGIPKKLFQTYSEHKKLTDTNFKNNPEILYASNYQDGLIHSFERILSLRKTGEYSHTCVLLTKIKEYERMQKTFLRKKSYSN